MGGGGGGSQVEELERVVPRGDEELLGPWGGEVEVRRAREDGAGLRELDDGSGG